MKNAFDPVILRMLFYILSPLIAMVPVSWVGLVAVQLTDNGHLIVNADLKGIISIGIVSAVGSAGVFAKWGTKPV